MTVLTEVREIREIVLDTETTGLYAKNGDRVIEVGCVELINRSLTGRVFHTYVNPLRNVPLESFRVHGISEDFLKDKPTFPRIVKQFLDFIGTSSVLVIHNAGFDISFLNAELALCGLPELSISRTIDTLNIARKKFPGSPASLDALCKRFNISLKNREKHGALIDAELLSMVYIELVGGGQSTLGLDQSEINLLRNNLQFNKQYREPRNFETTSQERAEHEKFLQKIKDSLWKKKGAN